MSSNNRLSDRAMSGPPEEYLAIHLTLEVDGAIATLAGDRGLSANRLILNFLASKARSDGDLLPWLNSELPFASDAEREAATRPLPEETQPVRSRLMLPRNYYFAFLRKAEEVRTTSLEDRWHVVHALIFRAVVALLSEETGVIAADPYRSPAPELEPAVRQVI